MTTVVIDFKNKQIAADSQTTSHFTNGSGEEISHTVHYSHNTEKIFKTGDVYIVGAGNSDAIASEKEYFVKYGSLRKKPTGEWTIAVVQVKGDFVQADVHQSTLKTTWYGKKIYKVESSSYLSNERVITFGSGGKYAYAGMISGMDAKDSVILASKCDVYTNANAQVVDLEV